MMDKTPKNEKIAISRRSQMGFLKIKQQGWTHELKYVKEQRIIRVCMNSGIFFR